MSSEWAAVAVPAARRGAVPRHGEREPVLGQPVLAERGDLDHEVEPVENRGGDSLCEAREHVFVKV